MEHILTEADGMYCPRCGELLQQGARFCSACGADIGSRIPRSAYPPSPNPRSAIRFVKFMAAAVIVIVLLASVINPLSQTDYDPYAPDRSTTFGDITLYGGLSDFGDLAVDGRTISYTGSSDSAVEWSFKILSAEAMAPVSGHYEFRGCTYCDGRSLTLPDPGNYMVTLSVDGSEKCSGRIILDGDIHETYTWAGYNSSGYKCRYTVGFDYKFSDYCKYAIMSGTTREYSPYADDSRFVVVDDSILGLEAALRAEFVRVNGDVRGSTYADYLLSFVQCIIKYPTPVSSGYGGMYYSDEGGYGDLYLFGQEEYWAYPMETLYLRQGDCEDTSFLTCALFSAAGYESAAVSIPGHMMVAIGLDSISSFVYSGYYCTDHLEFTATKKPVYFCETTYESAVPAGYYSQSNRDDLMDITRIDMIPPYAEDVR